MSDELKASLRKAWEMYKVYADSCVSAGSLPAPFGSTIFEQMVIQLVTAAHATTNTEDR